LGNHAEIAEKKQECHNYKLESGSFHICSFGRINWVLYGTIGLGFQGTGSYPLPPHGLQEAIRLNVNHPPFMGPCFLMASIPYTEQVGVYRHDGGRYGEMAYW